MDTIPLPSLSNQSATAGFHSTWIFVLYYTRFIFPLRIFIKSATDCEHMNCVWWCVVFVKAYADPTAGYLHGPPVYTGHQQGVVVQQGGTVTTIVTSQTVQPVTHWASAPLLFKHVSWYGIIQTVIFTSFSFGMNNTASDHKMVMNNNCFSCNTYLNKYSEVRSFNICMIWMGIILMWHFWYIKGLLKALL